MVVVVVMVLVVMMTIRERGCWRDCNCERGDEPYQDAAFTANTLHYCLFLWVGSPVPSACGYET